MTGYYVLAVVECNLIYAIHNKLYSSEKMAKSALEKLKRNKLNGKKYTNYDVWGITDLKKLK